VTLADLHAMFPGRVGNDAIVSQGLPSLNAQMVAAGIITPRRIAAFLATLAHESAFLYNIHQHSSTATYAGRGYIQLTGVDNYRAAGTFLGIDLQGSPDLALSLDWSAKIAKWYWTVARHINPFADALQMGKVNGAIGYPPGVEDGYRCDSFKAALKYLTGTVPAGITCTR
jgi:putative chitinase